VRLTDGETGQDYLRHSRFLITAAGFCDVPNSANGIDGIQSFAGQVFHSARWDHSFDFSDKSVAVVGNGSSANQFIPSMLHQSKMKQMVQFIRSPHWIAPKENSRVPAWQRW
jgi:cation diffusion facilitator CzcD-associated flavoprotein CzcO